MKKPTPSKQTEKRAKGTPEEKTARKSAKKAGRAATLLNDDRDDNKASQKKTLKTAAKQLQKELNNRMNEVVTRIRKETKAKLKEVVKEATRRLDGDTERMFEQALQTIVRHYDSVASTATGSDSGNSSDATATRGRKNKKGPTLNKDGSPRKNRATDEVPVLAAEAPTTRGRKPSAAASTATGARRALKPTAATTAAARRGPKPGTPAIGARRGPKPRAQAAPETPDALNPANGSSTSEVSE